MEFYASYKKTCFYLTTISEYWESLSKMFLNRYFSWISDTLSKSCSYSIPHPQFKNWLNLSEKIKMYWVSNDLFTIIITALSDITSLFILDFSIMLHFLSWNHTHSTLLHEDTSDSSGQFEQNTVVSFPLLMNNTVPIWIPNLDAIWHCFIPTLG